MPKLRIQAEGGMLQMEPVTIQNSKHLHLVSRVSVSYYNIFIIISHAY